MHLCLKIMLHLIEVTEPQLERLHMVETLHCKSPPRQPGEINAFLEFFLSILLLVLYEDCMVDDSVLKATMLEHFTLLMHRKHFLILFHITIRIHDGIYLVMIAG